MPVSARVFNIARASLHDGKGVRTVIYLKGCNMHCQWCHNPEGISLQPQILYVESRCIHCGLCIQTCPEHHSLESNRHVFRKTGCIVCGRCAQSCPVNALELCGMMYSPQDILMVIMKDKHYYDTSAGGVTFSGGECLLHADFMKEACRLCQEAGVSVTVESAMNIPWENVEPLLPYVDSFYADIKHMDSCEHQKYTGCDNRLILANIKRLAEYDLSILIRIPLIPGVNDATDHLIQTAAFAKSCGKAVQGLELLRYNILGKSKYAMLQEKHRAFAEEPQSLSEMNELCRQVNAAVHETDFVFWVP